MKVAKVILIIFLLSKISLGQVLEIFQEPNEAYGGSPFLIQPKLVLKNSDGSRYTQSKNISFITCKAFLIDTNFVGAQLTQNTLKNDQIPNSVFREGWANFTGLTVDMIGDGFKVEFVVFEMSFRIKSSLFNVRVGFPQKIMLLREIGIAKGGEPFRLQPVLAIVDSGRNIVRNWSLFNQLGINLSSAHIMVKISVHLNNKTVTERLKSKSEFQNQNFHRGKISYAGLYFNEATGPYTITFATNFPFHEFCNFSSCLHAQHNASSRVEQRNFFVITGAPSTFEIHNLPKQLVAGEPFKNDILIIAVDVGRNEILNARNVFEFDTLTIQVYCNGVHMKAEKEYRELVFGGRIKISDLTINKQCEFVALHVFTSFKTLLSSKKALIKRISKFFKVAVGQPKSIEFVKEPSQAFSGIAFLTQPVLRIVDAGGNVVTQHQVSVVAHCVQQTLLGMKTATANDGIVGFQHLRLDRIGYYTLIFNSSYIGLKGTTFNLTVIKGLEHVLDSLPIAFPVQSGEFKSTSLLNDSTLVVATTLATVSRERAELQLSSDVKTCSGEKHVIDLRILSRLQTIKIVSRIQKNLTSYFFLRLKIYQLGPILTSASALEFKTMFEIAFPMFGNVAVIKLLEQKEATENFVFIIKLFDPRSLLTYLVLDCSRSENKVNMTLKTRSDVFEGYLSLNVGEHAHRLAMNFSSRLTANDLSILLEKWLQGIFRHHRSFVETVQLKLIEERNYVVWTVQFTCQDMPFIFNTLTIIPKDEGVMDRNMLVTVSRVNERKDTLSGLFSMKRKESKTCWLNVTDDLETNEDVVRKCLLFTDFQLKTSDALFEITWEDETITKDLFLNVDMLRGSGLKCYLKIFKQDQLTQIINVKTGERKIMSTIGMSEEKKWLSFLKTESDSSTWVYFNEWKRTNDMMKSMSVLNSSSLLLGFPHGHSRQFRSSLSFSGADDEAILIVKHQKKKSIHRSGFSGFEDVVKFFLSFHEVIHAKYVCKEASKAHERSSCSEHQIHINTTAALKRIFSLQLLRKGEPDALHWQLSLPFFVESEITRRSGFVQIQNAFLDTTENSTQVCLRNLHDDSLFGASVLHHGNILLVSAPGYSFISSRMTSKAASGAVYVFVEDGSCDVDAVHFFIADKLLCLLQTLKSTSPSQVKSFGTELKALGKFIYVSSLGVDDSLPCLEIWKHDVFTNEFKFYQLISPPNSPLTQNRFMKATFSVRKHALVIGLSSKLMHHGSIRQGMVFFYTRESSTRHYELKENIGVKRQTDSGIGTAVELHDHHLFVSLTSFRQSFPNDRKVQEITLTSPFGLKNVFGRFLIHIKQKIPVTSSSLYLIKDRTKWFQWNISGQDLEKELTKHFSVRFLVTRSTNSDDNSLSWQLESKETEVPFDNDLDVFSKLRPRNGVGSISTSCKLVSDIDTAEEGKVLVYNIKNELVLERIIKARIPEKLDGFGKHLKVEGKYLFVSAPYRRSGETGLRSGALFIYDLSILFNSTQAQEVIF